MYLSFPSHLISLKISLLVNTVNAHEKKSKNANKNEKELDENSGIPGITKMQDLIHIFLYILNYFLQFS